MLSLLIFMDRSEESPHHRVRLAYGEIPRFISGNDHNVTSARDLMSPHEFCRYSGSSLRGREAFGRGNPVFRVVMDINQAK